MNFAIFYKSFLFALLFLFAMTENIIEDMFLDNNFGTCAMNELNAS